MKIGVELPAIRHLEILQPVFCENTGSELYQLSIKVMTCFSSLLNF